MCETYNIGIRLCQKGAIQAVPYMIRLAPYFPCDPHSLDCNWFAAVSCTETTKYSQIAPTCPIRSLMWWSYDTYEYTDDDSAESSASDISVKMSSCNSGVYDHAIIWELVEFVFIVRYTQNLPYPWSRSNTLDRSSGHNLHMANTQTCAGQTLHVSVCTVF
jgi:hypothetical protein